MPGGGVGGLMVAVTVNSLICREMSGFGPALSREREKKVCENIEFFC